MKNACPLQRYIVTVEGLKDTFISAFAPIASPMQKGLSWQRKHEQKNLQTKRKASIFAILFEALV
jgi:hypothetical protein